MQDKLRAAVNLPRKVALLPSKVETLSVVSPCNERVSTQRSDPMAPDNASRTPHLGRCRASSKVNLAPAPDRPQCHSKTCESVMRSGHTRHKIAICWLANSACGISPFVNPRSKQLVVGQDVRADIVDLHIRGKFRGLVGPTRPTSTDSEVDDQIHWFVHILRRREPAI